MYARVTARTGRTARAGWCVCARGGTRREDGLPTYPPLPWPMSVHNHGRGGDGAAGRVAADAEAHAAGTLRGRDVEAARPARVIDRSDVYGPMVLGWWRRSVRPRRGQCGHIARAHNGPVAVVAPAAPIAVVRVVVDIRPVVIPVIGGHPKAVAGRQPGRQSRRDTQNSHLYHLTAFHIR